LRDWIGLGFKEVFPLIEQPVKTFSWRDNRELAFPKNHGQRIGDILFSPELSAMCTSCAIDRQQRKGQKPSDHAPVFADRADYSYGIYVFAFPIQQTLVALIGPVTPLIFFAVCYPLIFLAAAASWSLAESKALALKSKEPPSRLVNAR
jgi:peptidoglycan/LPS O-acetylase OafA/YrhL